MKLIKRCKEFKKEIQGNQQEEKDILSSYQPLEPSLNADEDSDNTEIKKLKSFKNLSRKQDKIYYLHFIIAMVVLSALVLGIILYFNK